MHLFDLGAFIVKFRAGSGSGRGAEGGGRELAEGGGAEGAAQAAGAQAGAAQAGAGGNGGGGAEGWLSRVQRGSPVQRARRMLTRTGPPGGICGAARSGVPSAR
jgi:hypothetical protein